MLPNWLAYRRPTSSDIDRIADFLTREIYEELIICGVPTHDAASYVECWHEPQRRHSFRSLMERDMAEKNSFFIILHGADDEIFGLFIAETSPERTSGFIYCIRLSRQVQRCGIGKWLIDEFKKMVSGPIGLQVYSANAPAISFYKEQGFEYLPGHDEEVRVGNWIMTLHAYELSQQ